MKNIKQKLKYMSKHPFFGFIVFGLILLLVPLMSNVLSVTVTDAIVKTLIFFIVALGFAILMGYAGLASLGTSSFIAVGTFTLYTGMSYLGLGFFLTIVLAIIISVLMGVLFGVVSLRIEGMYLAIVTLGISEIMVEIFKNLDKFTGGVSGINLLKFTLFGIKLNDQQIFVVLVVGVVIAMMATFNIMNSPTGRAMLSIKNNDSAAQAMGISVIKYRLLAFIISTIFAVMGGIFYMSYVRFSIASTWNLALSLNILAAVIVGGSKSIWGILLGSFTIFGLDLLVFKNIPILANSKYANMSFVVSGVLIIVVIMFYPEGLIGLFKNIYYKIKNRKKEELADDNKAK